MEADEAAGSPARAAGRYGIWATELRFGDPALIAGAAAELDALGFGALWFPGGHGGAVLETVDMLLDAAPRAVIATGILNIWRHAPADVGAWWAGLAPARQARVMLGLGVGHAAAIGEAWGQPLTRMAAYLDALDGAGVSAASRCLAALGPRMLDLARDRTAGAHPYLVTPEHTAAARARLGPGTWLATEQGVILDPDPASARATARTHLETYAVLPNYQASWKRLGFTDADIADRSDRLVDALFAFGSAETVAARLRAHVAAGADHVCVQVVTGAPGAGTPVTTMPAWRALAAVLL